MKGFKEKSLADRLSEGAKAKQAQLERARAKSPANDPEFAARQEERKKIAEAREVRAAERAKEKLEAKAREAERRVAEEAARIEAEKLEAARREAEAAERKIREATLEIERKAARDARYAARKNRKK
jgi:phage protein D